METPAEETPSSASSGPQATIGNLAVDVLSGTGLGLLLGLIVGLATSPVVGVVVGALASILAVFLGLESGGEAKLAVLSKVQLNGVRIGCFGLAATCGVLLGQYIRINNPFAELPAQQLARWTKAFPDNPVLASQMMISERTGISASALAFQKDTPAVAVTVAAGAAATRPGLFSGKSAKDACRDLALTSFGDDVGKALDAYDDEGGPFATVAQQVRSLPETHRHSALRSAHTMLCALQRKDAAP